MDGGQKDITGKNGWKIGNDKDYDDYSIQDREDSESIYATLENKIIPAYYNKNKKGISDEWIRIMKESIVTTGGKYSTARMLVDYVEKMYIPLCNQYNEFYSQLENVAEYNSWKKDLYKNWQDIEIQSIENKDDISIDAGTKIQVKCKVKLPNILPENVEVQAYCGRILENGIIETISITPMEQVDNKSKVYEYAANIEFKTGGDFVYTFRVMPKHRMLLDSANLDLIKWMTKKEKTEIVEKLLELE